MKHKKTAYFSFHGDIHVTSVNNLIFNCEREIKDGAEHLYISISSRGGLTDSGFHLYNTLKALKAEVTMHNTGSVESAGFVAFLAGDNRISSADSRFLLHKPMRRFNSDTSFDEKQISEFSQLLRNDELNIRNIIIKDTTATKTQITAWFKMSKVFTPEMAQRVGIISGTAEFAVPGGHRLITVPTEKA